MGVTCVRQSAVRGADTDVVEELAVASRPSDLHDAGRHDGHLVEPDAAVDLEGAADALERRRVAARLRQTIRVSGRTVRAYDRRDVSVYDASQSL